MLTLFLGDVKGVSERVLFNTHLILDPFSSFGPPPSKNLLKKALGPRMLKDGLVVPEAYTALCTSQKRLETLEEQLRKKTLTLKHMKLEIGSIKTKNIVNYC